MKRFAFTLIELMTVTAVMGVLTGLLLPAIQQARESARQMQCGNNLKNFALAALNHESCTRKYPSGGWSSQYVGDPDRGFGKVQPGSWAYSLLPFMELNTLFQLGSDGTTSAPSSEKKSSVLVCNQKSLSIFLCPTRRPAISYPIEGEYLNCDEMTIAAKSDYAGNYGSTPMKVGNNASYEIEKKDIERTTRPTGVIYDTSEVSMGEIRDGSSNTYLIGEKFVYADQYEQAGAGDKTCMYAGIADDDFSSNLRSAGDLEAEEWYNPMQDVPGMSGNSGAWRGFGSPHAGTFGMAMCDGSVQRISYSIDGKTHACFANRSDGESVSVFTDM